MIQSARSLHVRRLSQHHRTARLTPTSGFRKTVSTTDNRVDYRPLLMTHARENQPPLWRTRRPYD